jgi:hypothetical protein
MHGYALAHALIYKGWLETRLRLAIVLGFMGLLLITLYSLRAPADAFAILASGFVVWSCSLFAGAGITTRRPFGSTPGGLALLTVSLPVTRFRLLAVRAGVGWVEMTAGIGIMCFGIWLVSPAWTATEMGEFAGTLTVCASPFYFLFVLVATFLDGKAHLLGIYTIFAAVWWLSGHTQVPASLNIYQAMGEGSPLVAHTMPWSAMALSLGLAAILFFAALKIVQVREY